MDQVFASLSEKLQPRLDEMSVRLAPLEQALAQGGLLGEYRSRLRDDLLAVMNLLGHSWSRAPDRELWALAIAEWTLTRNLSLSSKLKSLSVRADWVASQFFDEEMARLRVELREAGNGKRLGIPAFLDGIEGDPRLAVWSGELAKGLYSLFTWIVRLDGTIQPDEAAGFKAFWEQYKPLQDAAGRPIGTQPMAASPLPDRPSALAPDRPLNKFVPQAWGLKTFPSRESSPLSDRPAAVPEPAAKSEHVIPVPSLPAATPEVDLSEALAELEELTGMASIKAEVKSLANLLRIQALRKQRGLVAVPVSLHTVFTGNPGTGKTSVARLYARILRGLGILSKGHLVETDRSGLVAGYMGQTGEKVDAVVQSALDGVLFIDEAYSLAGEDSSDYGHEAISTLLSRMENHRDRLVVVVAGYSHEMDVFLDANPGLRSRFPRKWDFPDYAASEMTEIFARLCTKHGLELEPEAEFTVRRLADAALAKQDPVLGNARFVRNLFEACISRQADRLAGLEHPTNLDLQTITACDLV